MKYKKVHIKDCADVQPGFSAKGAIANEPGGTLQVITAQHLAKGEWYEYKAEHQLLIHPPKAYENYLVHQGDILFMSRGANNYSVLIKSAPEPAIAPLTFYIIRPHPQIDPEYLAWCLNQEPVRAQLNMIRTGAGTPMIPRQEFGEITIPLPPLSAQRVIAQLAALQAREKALIEEYAKELDRLHLATGNQLFRKMPYKDKE